CSDVLPREYAAAPKCLPPADVRQPSGADDERMLTSRLAAHPRRTLIAVLLFVVLAGAIGGPVAGALESSGGFVAPGADSEVAVDRIEAATGVEPGPGLVLLVEDPSPGRLGAIERELSNV